jgi:hypothetical protein
VETLAAKQKQNKTAPAVRRQVMTSQGQHAAVRAVLRNAKIQPKLLHIGRVNDKYEQEADRVAEQVMRKPAPQEKQAR